MTKQIKFGVHPVAKIQILRGLGTDKISFVCVCAPTPFPQMQKSDPKGDYSPYFGIEVRRGYAEEWLKLMFGIDLPDSRVTMLDMDVERKNVDSQ